MPDQLIDPARGEFHALMRAAAAAFTERSPLQDLQYGLDRRLCADPVPWRVLERRLRRASGAREIVLRGAAETLLGRYARAVRSLTSALAADPDRAWAHAWRGVARALAARRRRTQDGLKTSLADLDRAAEGEARPFALPWRAEIRHDLDDHDGALSDLAELPPSAWTRVERGEILCEKGRLSEAMAIFDRLVEDHPRAGWARALRGRTLATSGKPEESLRDLELAARLEPHSAAILTWLAQAKMKLGRYREACAHLDAAVRLDSAFVLARLWRGRLRLMLGQPRAALPDLDRAVRLDRRYSLGLAWRGEALFKLGRRREARRDFLAAAPLDLSRTWNAVVEEGQVAAPEERRRAWLEDRCSLAPARLRARIMGLMAKGRGIAARGLFAEAEPFFSEALRRDPHCAQALLYRAGLRLAMRDLDGAAGDFKGMEEISHKHLPAYRDLNTISAEERPELLDASERLRAAHPGLPWALVFHSFTLRSLMRYREAVEVMELAAALRPASAALRAMLSRVKLTNAAGGYDGARDMEEAVRLAPGWGWLHCWLGEARRHQGRWAQALQSLDRGLALDASYLRGYAWRGGVLASLGRYPEAIEDLTRSLRWDPVYSHDFEYTSDQKSWAYNQRMLCRRALGGWRGALADLDKAHRLGPRYAWCFNPKDDPAVYAASIEELGRAIAALPRSASAWAWRGQTKRQAGRPREALADLDRAVSLDPRRGWIWAMHGKALSDLEEDRQALESLERAVRLDPGYAPGAGWLAQAERRRGDLRRALREFTRAVALDHRAAWALAGRGECLLRLGQADLALVDLERAHAICPGYAQAGAWRAEALREARIGTAV